MKKFVSEFLGTFALVFFGTGDVVVNHIWQGSLENTGIAIVFGVVVMGMIFAFGSISGAHINPAVTLGFACTKIFQLRQVVVYLIAQFLGAVMASLIVCFLFDHPESIGETIPQISISKTLILEFILTYFLMLVILLVSQNPKFKNYTAIAVGGIVMLEALFAGPVTGASMNPARSFSPALVSGNLTDLWIYFLAPISGAVLASITWNLLFGKS